MMRITIFLIVLTAKLIAGCRHERCSPCSCDTVLPQISCPAIPSNVITGPLQRTANVCWNGASASDNCCLRNVIPSGSRCNSFDAGSYSYPFTAYDCSGNAASCTVIFTVKVVSCMFMNYPENANSITYSSLYLPPVYGHIAKITCKTGYTISGPDTQTCLPNADGTGSWSDGGSSAVTCTVVTCPNFIPLPTNMYIVASTGYNYGDIAMIACSYQLTLVNGAPFVQCELSGTWSNTTANCQDYVAPVLINCPASFQAYSDKQLAYTYVNWIAPKATDNYDVTVSVVLTGPAPGSKFVESPIPYTIRYDAADSSGNQALPCIFSFTVSAITCDPNGIPMSAHQWENCTNGYRWGSSCTLGCFDGYPLIGPSTVTCETNSLSSPTAQWNWNGGSASYCGVIQCPALNNPENGALSCSTWTNGPICQIHCNSDYDIPEIAVSVLGAGVGMYVCSTITGTWLPQPPVPDCSDMHFPGDTYIMSSLSYYYGDCSSPAAQQQIAANFIEALGMSAFQSVCQNVPQCTVDNVQVICGAGSGKRKRNVETGREKRQSTNLNIKFQFRITLTGLNRKNMTASNIDTIVTKTFNGMKQIMLNDIAAGKYNTLGILGLSVNPKSFLSSRKTLNCPLGMSSRIQTYSCAPCAKGTFFNSTVGKCQWCPIGKYQNQTGQFQCTSCPPTYSTLDVASISDSQCLPPCQPGSYSRSGLQPCGLCQPGSYQPNAAQTSCLECPLGQTGLITGAVSITTCKAYEIRFPSFVLDQSPQISLVSNFSDIVYQYSVTFMTVATSTGQIMAISQGQSVILSLANAQSLTMETQANAVDIGYAIDDSQWHKIAIVVDAINCTMTLYDGTTELYSSNTADICELSLYSLITIQLGSSLASFQGIITQFSLVPDNNVPVVPPSDYCQIDDNQAIVRWTNILSSKDRNNINIGITSCGALSPCLASPCGIYGSCEVTLDYKYTCTCTGNYTGVNCTVPPNYCNNVVCANKGNCVNLADDFKCVCPKLYTGTYCEDSIVDGQWCPWNGWTTCSVTCGGGWQSHDRNCSCPAPMTDGQYCKGNSTELRSCNTQACGTCPPLPALPPNVQSNCTTLTPTYAVCVVSCFYGYIFNSSNTVQEYVATCSSDLNLQWSVDISKLPVCQKLELAKSVTMSSIISYPIVLCSSIKPLQSAVQNNLANLNSQKKCFQKRYCKTSIKASTCTSSNAKAQNQSTNVQVSYKVAPAANTMWKNGYFTPDYSIGVADDMRMRLIDIRDAAAALLNATANGKLNFRSSVPLTTVPQVLEVMCQPGSINWNGFCAQCAPGYYNKGAYCLPCAVGYYQPNAGQMNCTACFSGYTSNTTGSISCYA